MFISSTAAADYSERFRDMYTFSELILNIRKVGKIDSRKMQGQSPFRLLMKILAILHNHPTFESGSNHLTLFQLDKNTF